MTTITIQSDTRQGGASHAVIYAITGTLLDLERAAVTKKAMEALRKEGHFDIAILAHNLDHASAIRGAITSLYQRLKGSEPWMYNFHLVSPEIRMGVQRPCAHGVLDGFGVWLTVEQTDWVEAHMKLVNRMYRSIPAA